MPLIFLRIKRSAVAAPSLYELICIGDDVSERVAIKPAEVWVIRDRRKKYACKICEGAEDERGGIVTAEEAKHLLPGSLACESLLTNMNIGCAPKSSLLMLERKKY